MRKLSMGIVGVGDLGRHLVEHQILRGEAEPYVALAGLCDLDLGRVRSLADRWGVAAYPSLAAMLADERIETVGVFTGPAGRADLVRQCIRAGKHVMTTKPFELDPRKTMAVLTEARELEKVVHLNSPAPLLSPELAQIQAWREEFELGRPVAARFETWGVRHEQADGSWYDDPQRCPVAPILRLGVYCINDLVRLVGPAESVQVVQTRLRTGRPTPDNAMMMVRFADGAIASVLASFCIDDGRRCDNTKALGFENGSIYCDVGTLGTGGEMRLQLVRRENKRPRVVRDMMIDSGTRSGNYQWEAFHRAVHGQRLDGQVTAEQIAGGVAILDAMARAAESEVSEAVWSPAPKRPLARPVFAQVGYAPPLPKVAGA